jgi:hypothetical protein
MIGFCKDDFLGSILALLVINRTILLSFPNRSKSFIFIPIHIGFKATPDSIAKLPPVQQRLLILDQMEKV